MILIYMDDIQVPFTREVIVSCFLSPAATHATFLHRILITVCTSKKIVKFITKYHIMHNRIIRYGIVPVNPLHEQIASTTELKK